jgi:hypothetical protein
MARIYHSNDDNRFRVWERIVSVLEFPCRQFIILMVCRISFNKKYFFFLEEEEKKFVKNSATVHLIFRNVQLTRI